MEIYLGSDHRGFKLKEALKNWLKDLEIPTNDLGAFQINPEDDYPEIAKKVGVKVAGEKSSRGILICGSGVGVDIAVNKIDGIRASLGKEPDQVAAGRRDDDMNVLVLASDFTTDIEAKEMVQVFLETEFSAKERFVRRLSEINKLEKNN